MTEQTSSNLLWAMFLLAQILLCYIGGLIARAVERREIKGK